MVPVAAGGCHIARHLFGVANDGQAVPDLALLFSLVHRVLLSGDPM